AFGGLTTRTLCRRIGRDELGIGGFQALEFVIQGIVFGVADARAVLDVILMLMQMNRLTQLVQALRDHSEVFHKVSLEQGWTLGEHRCAGGPWLVVSYALMTDRMQSNLVCSLPLQRPGLRLAGETVLAYQGKE